MTELELRRRYCRDGNAHSWKIHNYGTEEHVYCARCMVPLATSEMLSVYIERYGGTRTL